MQSVGLQTPGPFRLSRDDKSSEVVLEIFGSDISGCRFVQCSRRIDVGTQRWCYLSWEASLVIVYHFRLFWMWWDLVFGLLASSISSALSSPSFCCSNRLVEERLTVFHIVWSFSPLPPPDQDFTSCDCRVHYCSAPWVNMERSAFLYISWRLQEAYPLGCGLKALLLREMLDLNVLHDYSGQAAALSLNTPTRSQS